MTKNKKPSPFKRFIKSIFLILFILTLLMIAINLYIFIYSAKYVNDIEEIEKIEEKQVVMALGAKVWRSGSLSYILRDRVEYAIDIYNLEKAEKLLFSGDHGTKEYDEVNAMMDYAVDKGIPKSDIFLDHAGFSTYESMFRAKEVFECDDIIIVTQGFHIYRSVYIARKLGMDAIGVKANQTNYVLRIDVKNFVREFFARVKDFIYIEFSKPDPTYLGEVIPISGDAYFTHDK